MKPARAYNRCMIRRRTFIKASLAGAVLLAAGAGASWLIGRDAAGDRRAVLEAVIPAILDGALPPAGAAREAALATARQGVDTAIGALAPAAQDELAQLFALLAIPPTRLALTGMGHPWREADVAEVSAILQGWRTHRLALMRSAYQALHDLVTGSWYADAAHWPAIGYPGPPRL